ncbi:tetratricopeptide (TPR) repeat protein [Haloferula luteola]|uniref:Tetratricopeptide (TPR) repeat protein n=1 Tax=Haloferula luteola TaxID=595692 RepID=A0A840VAM0_9BACT|nr:tetratricopeptide repeat protein [Haloferula luteola]MBB5349951.1 tetratricopeptide (TPR) repeat protein [Haloferula luteola]
MRTLPVVMMVFEGIGRLAMDRIHQGMVETHRQVVDGSLSIPPPRSSGTIGATLLTGVRSNQHGYLTDCSPWGAFPTFLELLERQEGERVVSMGWMPFLGDRRGESSRSGELRVMPEEIDVSVLREVLSPEVLASAEPAALTIAREMMAEAFTVHARFTEEIASSHVSVATVRYRFHAGLRRHFQVAEDGGGSLAAMLVNRVAELVGRESMMMVIGFQEEATSGVYPREAWSRAILGGDLLAAGSPARGTASLLDIGPTVLACRGWQSPEHLEGVAMGVWLAFPEGQPVMSCPTSFSPPADLEEAPENLEAIWNRALSLDDAGKKREASPSFLSVFRLHPENSERGRVCAKCLLELGRLESARQVLDVLIHYRHPRGALELLEAWCRFLESRTTEAVAIIDGILQGEVLSPEVASELGMLLYRVKDWARLSKLARSLEPAMSHSAWVQLGLAVGLAAEGDDEKAAERAAMAVNLRVDLPFAYTVLGSSLAKLGRREEAKEALLRALHLTPRDPDTLRILIHLLENMGEFADASVLRRTWS